MSAFMRNAGMNAKDMGRPRTMRRRTLSCVPQYFP